VRALACCLLLLSAVGVLQPVQAEELTLAGGRQGGLWTRIGLGLAQAVKTDPPKIVLSYLPSHDGVTNAKLLSRGATDLALIQAAELAAARGGLPPFEAPLEGLTAVASLDLTAPVYVLVRASSLGEAASEETPSLQDFATREGLVFGLMPADGVSAEIGRTLLRTAGVAATEERVRHGGLRQQLARLASGEIDVLLAPIVPRHRAVAEIHAATPLALLSLAPASVELVQERFGLTPLDLAPDTHGLRGGPVATAGSELVLAARAMAEDSRIEAFTRALYENLDQLRAVHPLLSGLTRQRMAAVRGAPLHPGAQTYLAARGLLNRTE
jgi:TRAP transporter TAXI family solute receptor